MIGGINEIAPGLIRGKPLFRTGGVERKIGKAEAECKPGFMPR
jgi:hypothetical protein